MENCDFKVSTYSTIISELKEQLAEIIPTHDFQEICDELKTSYNLAVDKLYADKILAHNNNRSKLSSNKLKTSTRQNASPTSKSQKCNLSECNTRRNKKSSRQSASGHNFQNQPSKSKQGGTPRATNKHLQAHILSLTRPIKTSSKTENGTFIWDPTIQSGHL